MIVVCVGVSQSLRLGRVMITLDTVINYRFSEWVCKEVVSKENARYSKLKCSRLLLMTNIQTLTD